MVNSLVSTWGQCWGPKKAASGAQFYEEDDVCTRTVSFS